MSDEISPVTLRTAAGLSQAEAAALLEVHRRTLDRYEQREQSPNAETIGRMAALYRLPEHLVGSLVRFWGAP